MCVSQRVLFWPKCQNQRPQGQQTPHGQHVHSTLVSSSSHLAHFSSCRHKQMRYGAWQISHYIFRLSVAAAAAAAISTSTSAAVTAAAAVAAATAAPQAACLKMSKLLSPNMGHSLTKALKMPVSL